jgi:hypothetical protein
MQAEPMKPTLKAPGTKRLKRTHDKLLSSFAVIFNLRRYKEGGAAHGAAIDSHDVVMRLNQAPTWGYRRWVGGRTTHRVGTDGQCSPLHPPYCRPRLTDGQCSPRHPPHCRPLFLE